MTDYKELYRRMKNVAAGYSNFCEESGSTRRLEKEYAAIEQEATQPQPEPTSKGEPVSEEIAAMLGERIAFLRDPAVYRGKYWDSMTNEQRKRAFTRLDGGAAGYKLGLWTWKHFDMGAEDIGVSHRGIVLSDALVFELTGHRPEQLVAAEAEMVRRRAAKRWSELIALSSQQRETQEAAEPIPTGVHYGGQFDNFYDSATLAGMGTDFWLRWKHRRDEFPTAPQEAGKAEKCKTCNGHGLIGGFVSDGDGGGGYDSEPCPECNSKEAGKVEAVADEREAFEHWWRLAPEGDTPLSDVHTERDRRLALLAWRARASLYLRPSQQALGEEQISEWALRMFEMDVIDIEIELRRILAAAGGSEK